LYIETLFRAFIERVLMESNLTKPRDTILLIDWHLTPT